MDRYEALVHLTAPGLAVLLEMVANNRIEIKKGSALLDEIITKAERAIAAECSAPDKTTAEVAVTGFQPMEIKCPVCGCLISAFTHKPVFGLVYKAPDNMPGHPERRQWVERKTEPSAPVATYDERELRKELEKVAFRVVEINNIRSIIKYVIQPFDLDGLVKYITDWRDTSWGSPTGKKFGDRLDDILTHIADMRKGGENERKTESMSCMWRSWSTPSE